MNAGSTWRPNSQNNKAAPSMPFPMSNPQPGARPRNSLAETPAASCSSHADGRPGTKPLASRPRPGTKAPPNAAPAPCRPNSLQPPESYSADTPAGPPRRSPPAPQGGGARVPGRAAPRFHAPASQARAGHRSAALGGGARWGLSAPAAHRAPSSSSPGPSLRAHTHLTSARIKTRGAAPDGGPRRSRARPECRRAARTARPRAAHSSPCRGCCKLEWVRRRRRGRETGREGRTCRLTVALHWSPASHRQTLQPLLQVPIDCEDQAAGDQGCCFLPAKESPDLEFSSPEYLKEASLQPSLLNCWD